MSKIKVTKASPNSIELANGIILGANKHPNFFKFENGFRIPTIAKGEEVEIPEEAIAYSSEGRPYLVGNRSLESLQKEEVLLSISLKKKQLELAEL